MKKRILLVLFVLLLLSSSSILAETKDVMGKYIEGNRPDVVAVNISFGDMNFEFKDADKVWDSSKHVYKDSPSSTGVWVVLNSSNNITIKSDSSKNVNVQLSFTPTNDNPGLTGLFTKDDVSITNFTLNKPEENASATEAVVEFMPSGKMNSSSTISTKIGTITLTIN